MSDDFDPDAYLKSKGVDTSDFDPDAYLGTKAAAPEPRPERLSMRMPTPKAQPGHEATAGNFLKDMMFPTSLPPQEAPVPGTLGPEATGIVNTVNQAGMGLGDKATAFLQSLYERAHGLKGADGKNKSIPELYENNLHQLDETKHRSNAAYPKEADEGAATGFVMSMAANPGAGAAVAKRLGAAGLKGALVRGGVDAGLMGAAEGFGGGRGSFEENLGKGVESGAISAVPGMVLSGTGYGLGKAFSGAKSLVREYMEAKAREALQRAAEADAEKLASGASADVAGDLDSTVARRARLGGEVNAAANNAQNRLAVASQADASLDPEAAKFMVNRQRQFNGSRRSTPEYQNLGNLTEVAPRAEIAGANAAKPRMSQLEAHNAAKLSTDPGADLRDLAEAGIQPKTIFDSETPDVHEFQYRNGEVVRVPDAEITANGRAPLANRPIGPAQNRLAPPPERPALPAPRPDPLAAALQHPANQPDPVGVFRGALQGAANGHGAIGSASKGALGAYDAIGPAKQYEMARAAQQFLNSSDPKARFYGYLLMKAANRTGAVGAASLVDERQP